LFCRTDELKQGELVGEDKYGNKYYRNDEHIMGQSAPPSKFKKIIL